MNFTFESGILLLVDSAFLQPATSIEMFRDVLQAGAGAIRDAMSRYFARQKIYPLVAVMRLGDFEEVLQPAVDVGPGIWRDPHELLDRWQAYWHAAEEAGFVPAVFGVSHPAYAQGLCLLLADAPKAPL